MDPYLRKVIDDDLESVVDSCFKGLHEATDIQRRLVFIDILTMVTEIFKLTKKLDSETE